MRIVAIDPGAKGCIVTLTSEQGPITFLDIPLIQGPGRKKVVDVDVVRIHIDDQSPDIVVLEAVHTAPRDGGVSGGSFMLNFGSLIGACAGHRREFILPQHWKSFSGLRNCAKQASVDKACLYYRGIDPLIRGYKNSVDRADATLIGRYGLFKFREV